MTECKIVISNSLDEYIIRDVILEGAKIDSFGVGERLITARSEPVFGGVYKLSGIGKDGKLEPKMKISENVEKITNPGFKKVVRFFGKETGKAMADVIMLHDEPLPDGRPYEIFDPNAVWKRKVLDNYEARELLVRIFDKGELVYDMPGIEEIKKTCTEQVDTLWGEVLRFENPQTYYVDLSKPIFSINTAPAVYDTSQEGRDESKKDSGDRRRQVCPIRRKDRRKVGGVLYKRPLRGGDEEDVRQSRIRA